MEAAARQDIQLEASWLDLLADEFDQDYMRTLRDFLRREKAAGKVIHPPGGLIFNALDSVPFDQVKVVILGQDPYHGPGQAHGLCFSVQRGVAPPPSLLNIYKELRDCLGVSAAAHGCLENWARQGVLLLNSVLTVEQSQPGSHRGKGWERFTDRIVALLNDKREDLVFLLWGSYAQEKGRIIDRGRHRVLEAPHPSPLSAHRGFLGSRHFALANDYLRERGIEPIDWRPGD